MRKGVDLYPPKFPLIKIHGAIMGVQKFRRPVMAAGKIWPDDDQVGAVPTVVTGWASYNDTLHTVGSPQNIALNTDTVLTNNAGNVIDPQKPADVTTFWDETTNKITGRNGDSLDVMIYFKAVPSAQNQWVDVWFDIGGTIGELYRQTFSFPQGAGVPRGIVYALPSAYTLGTWEANGATVYVRSNATLSIYNKVFNFDRSHKAV